MTATVQALPFRGQIDEPTAFQLIRREKRVPAVLLGRHDTEQILSLQAMEVEAAIGSDDEAALFRLDVEGEIIWARVSDLDRDPYTHALGYVELTRLPAGEPVAMDVPVEVLSKSAHRSRGQVVQQVESVRIEGPVEMLPEVLRIDARRIQPAQSVTLADLDLPTGCQPVDISIDTPLVIVVPKTETAKKASRAIKQ